MANISGKVTEIRFKWFRHVRRRQHERVCMQIIEMEPSERRKEEEENRRQDGWMLWIET